MILLDFYPCDFKLCLEITCCDIICDNKFVFIKRLCRRFNLTLKIHENKARLLIMLDVDRDNKVNASRPHEGLVTYIP